MAKRGVASKRWDLAAWGIRKLGTAYSELTISGGQLWRRLQERPC